MRIVVLDGYASNPNDISWEPLRSLGDVALFDRTPADKAIERIGDAEILLVNKVSLGEEIFAACPSVKYVGLLSTGYNIIDLAAANRHGVTVSNVPAYSTPSVTQHTFSLLLELCVHTGAHNQTVHQGKWCKSPDYCYWDAPLTELYGKTLGLIGFGQIGKAVARVALCFGMKVVACASRPRSESGVEGVAMLSFPELLRASDIVSLHCPLTENNLNMICAETISQMKDGVFIINTARGGLINEADLARALTSGKVGGFGADVLMREPPAEDCPLLSTPNTVITPHIAWAPLEARRRLIAIATENVRMFLDGHPQNTVN